MVTLPTQENIKLLKQLESGFKIKINWNKYIAKTTHQARSRYLDFLIVLGFQGVNGIFVLSFKDNNGRRKLLAILSSNCRNNRLCLTDGRNFLGQPTKNDLKTYDKIRKIARGQGNDYIKPTLNVQDGT